MESFDGAEVCRFDGIYILRFLVKLSNKNDCGPHRDDGLFILRNVNDQQVGGMRRNIIKIFKVIGFAMNIEQIVFFFDITFNFKNGTWRLYQKPNDLLSYINKTSNQAPQIINQIQKTINDRLSRNSSDEEIFNLSKHQ